MAETDLPSVDLKDLPQVETEAGQLRVAIKPGIDPQNPMVGSSLVLTPEPAVKKDTFYKTLTENPDVRALWYPHCTGVYRVSKAATEWPTDLNSGQPAGQFEVDGVAVLNASDDANRIEYRANHMDLGVVTEWTEVAIVHYDSTVTPGSVELTRLFRGDGTFSGGFYLRYLNDSSSVFAVEAKAKFNANRPDNTPFYGINTLDDWNVVAVTNTYNPTTGEFFSKVRVNGLDGLPPRTGEKTSNIGVGITSFRHSTSSNFELNSSNMFKPALYARMSYAMTAAQQINFLADFKADHNIQ